MRTRRTTPLLPPPAPVMKPVPQELRQLVKQTAPPEAEVMPLPWTYEHETYNIAMVRPETVDRSTVRQIEERIIDALIDYDTAHKTFTLCMVWDEKPPSTRPRTCKAPTVA